MMIGSTIFAIGENLKLSERKLLRFGPMESSEDN